jgi:hypothetical protein
LHNQQLPVMALMGCHVGNFAIPGYPSLAVDLVMLPRGGAAAVWSPLGLSYNPKRVDLAAAFLGATTDQSETLLGGAILRAFEALAPLPAAARRELVGTQVLLGDPATPLPR